MSHQREDQLFGEINIIPTEECEQIDEQSQMINSREQSRIKLQKKISFSSSIQEDLVSHTKRRDSFYDLYESVELMQMNTGEIFNNVQLVFTSSIAVSLGMLLQFVIISINLHFVGQMKDPINLDAVGMANLLVNCSGGFLLILLILFGQHEELAYKTQYYLSNILLGLFCNFLSDLFRNYLNGQEIYAQPMIILIFGCIFHFIATQILFEKYSLLGTIYSTNLTYFITLVFFQIFIWWRGLFPVYTFSHFGKHLKEYFKENTSIAIPVQMDFIAFEVNGLFVGSLKDLTQFGAHLALANFVSLFYSFPTGMGGAFMYLTSNAVGANQVQRAKNYCVLAYFLSFTEGLIFLILMQLFSSDIASFYTQNKLMQKYFVQILNIYTYCVICDNMQTAISGVVKGMGKANEALFSFVIAYICIGIPMSIILGFIFGLGLNGFWYGFICAIYSVLILLSYILYQTDFKSQIQIMKSNIRSDSIQIIDDNMLENSDKEE